MDPSMLGGMAEMFKNPEMMKSMEAMMENPEMQKMLNDPNMISNMMGILGNAGINLPTEPPTSIPTQENQENQENQTPIEIEISRLFENGDKVILHNLKKEIYNNLEATVVDYDNNSQRYTVLLEDDKRLSIKEANLKAPTDLEIVD